MTTIIVEDDSVPPVQPPPVYATVQDMVDRFRETEMTQISDPTGAADGMDGDAIERAIADASAEIDTYLVSRYTLPLATVPRVLINVCCDVARYRLYEDRATEQVSKRYDDAIKLLTKLSTGQIGLGNDVLQQPVPSSGGGPEFTTPARVFSAGQLADY